MRHVRMLLVGALSIAGSALPAQQASNTPRIIQIYQEMVKPGKNFVHESHEAGWVTAFAQSGLQFQTAGLTAVTGGNDALFFTPAQSYAELEQVQEKMAQAPGFMAKMASLMEKDGDYLANVRSLIAVRVDTLSPFPMPEFGSFHGLRMTTYRVKIGHEDEFIQARRMLNDAYQRAGINPKLVTYAITQGVNVPTYVIMRPYTKMAEWDEYSAWEAKARAGVSAEEMAKYNKLLEGAVLTRETAAYAISPKMSYVNKQTASLDPAFWKESPGLAILEKASVMQAGKPAKKP